MKKILLLLQVCFLLTASIKLQAQCNAPFITSFTPNTGFIGSTVTITGGNFDPIPANNQVFFGAAQATVLTASFGVLTVQVPVGATTAPISVKNGCNLIGYSSTSFNGIFCPTPINAGTYNNVAFELSGVVGAYNMLSQDIDLDGKPDIVVEGFGQGISIAKNNSTPGNLNFSAHNFSTGNARSVAVADFDGDGRRDVFVTNSILRNTSTPGTISFGSPIPIPDFQYQIATGDFNGDGKVDLVGDANGNMYVMLNTSSGVGNISFGSAQDIGHVGATCTGLQAADIDGDGKVDVIGTQGNADRAVTLRNTTTTGSTSLSFQAAEFWSTGGSYPYRNQLADFDKDGKIDLATVNYNSPLNTVNTAVLRNTSTIGDISFSSATTYPGPNNNYRIGVGDVNGDGLPDIVTKSLAVVAFAVYPNTSSGPGNISFSPRFDYPSAATAEVSGIVIGDLDGDFVPDIATGGISSNTIRFHRNTSAQVDNTPPTAVCKNITAALSPSGTVTVTPQMIDNGSSDACGLATLLINDAASVRFTCADIGPRTVTLKVIDKAGNSSTCQATVTVAPAAIIVVGQTTVCQGQTVTMQANQGDSYQWQKDGVNIPGATNQTYVATASGDYRVAVTNAGGCSGISAPVTITINDNPTVTVTPSGNVSLCPPNNNLVLSASVSSSYQWRLNGTDIPGANQRTYNVTTAGTYSVRVVDLFGCTAVSDPVVVSATDNIAPVARCKNVTVRLNANGSASVTVADINNGSSDNCGIGSMTLSGRTTYSCTDVGQTIPVTLVVTDNNGNVSQCVAQVTVTDPNSSCNTTNTTWYRDWDNDGFGDPTRSVVSPTRPAGYVSNNLDCNDYRVFYQDNDNDGWGNSTKVPCGQITRTNDCNDNDPRVHSLQTFYRDADGDFYGDANNSITVCSSVPPAGYVRNNIDCNDNDKSVYWPKTYYRDADGDGLGDPNNRINVCSSTPPAGYVSNSRDTNDTPVTVSNTRTDKAGDALQRATPDRFTLAAYPNPFNRQTRIQYTVPVDAQVNIRVFDVLGREVGLIFNGQRNAGTHYAEYNTSKLSSGMYYCRMVAIADGKEIIQTQKLVKTE